MGGVSVRSRVCRVACASVEARRARDRFLETRDVEGARGGSLCERLKLIISALVANFGNREVHLTSRSGWFKFFFSVLVVLLLFDETA